MDQVIKDWLFDPLVSRIVAVLVALIVFGVVLNFIKRTLARNIKDTNTRYRAKNW